MISSKKHVRIPIGELRIDSVGRDAVGRILDSGRVSEGKMVREFEEEWAKYIGTRYAVALNSGTSALIAGLTALKYYSRGLRTVKGTKIITTPLTYIATSNAVVLSGFEPVYVDVDEDTFCLAPENVQMHLENVDDPEEYSLVLPVHLMGQPCRMDEINKIAKKYGLRVFEDSAQAHGTSYGGRKVGSMSLLSDFSFYIAHNIQVGEMGIATTSDYELARLIRKIKANGRVCECPSCTRNTTGCPKSGSDENDFDPRFTHDMIGYNFKAMEFQAALGLAQLRKIDQIIERRRANVKYLNDHLEKFSNVIQLPRYDRNVSYMAYAIVLKNPKKGSRRRIRMKLERLGVETRPLFGCIPTQQPAYGYLKDKYDGTLPIAEFVGSNGFYIGCHQYLTREDLDYIAKAFGAACHELLE
jgi:CDP-6-deoxy-D-xylo-4-hexulose-3-dehydrase